MATERLDIDVALRRIQDLEKMAKDISQSKGDAEQLLKTFGKMNTEITRLSRETLKFQQALSQQSNGRSLGQTGSMLAKGSPAAFLTNSATTGQIKEFESRMDQTFTRLTNKFAKGLNDAVKAVENNRTLRLAETRQTVPGTSADEMRRQLRAQDLRIAQAEILKTQTQGTARRDANLQLQNELAARQRISIALEKQIAQEKVATEQIRQQEKMAKQIADTKARMANKELQQVQRQSKIDNVVGDGGAALFKIQSQLLVNYALMNAFIGTFQFGVQYVLEFDRALRDLQAITGSTETDLLDLSKAIIDASEATRFSATEVAKAATIMGQAGFSAAQIKDSIKDVTLFATAVGSDLESAVDLATSAMGVFNLQASEMGHVANVLTGAVNLTKLTVDKLALGIQYAGNTAAEMGLSLEELTAILGAMSNAGIRSGSTLGTGLRQMLVELQAPSKKFIGELKKVGLTIQDVDVEAKGFTGVLETLREAGFSSANAFKAFEVRAASAFLAASRNADTIRDLEIQLSLSNAAAEANEKQMKALANQFDNLKSVIGSVIYTMAGPLQSVLGVITPMFTSLLSILNEYPAILGTIGTSAGIMLAAFAVGKFLSLINGVQELATALKTAEKGANAASVAATRFTTVARTAALSLGGITLALTAVAVAYDAFSSSSATAANSIDRLQANFDDSKASLDETKGRITSLDDEISKLNNRYGELSTNSGALQSEVIRMQVKFGEFTKDLSLNTITTVEQLITVLRNLRGELSQLSVAQASAALADNARLISKSVAETVDKTRKGYIRPAEKSSFLNPSIDPGSRVRPAFTENILGQLNDIYEKDLYSATAEQRDEIKRTLSGQMQTISESKGKAVRELDKLEKDARRGVKVNQTRIEELNNQIGYLNEVYSGVTSAYSKVINQDSLSRLISDSKVEASKVGKEAADEVQRLDKQLSVANSKLVKAKTDAQRKAITKEIEGIKKEASELSKTYNDPNSQYAKDLAAETGLTAKEAVNHSGAYIQDKLASIASEAGDDLGGMTEALGKSTADFFDRLTEEQKMGVEKVKREIERATDGIDRSINLRKALIEESQDVRSPQYGKYSDAERKIFEREVRDLETQRIKARIDAIKAGMPALEGMIDRQKQLYDQAFESYKNSGNSTGKLQELLAVEKDVNSALDDRRNLVNELNGLQDEYNIRTGQTVVQNKTLLEQIKQTVSEYQKQMQVEGDLFLNVDKTLTEIFDTSRSSFSQFVKESVSGSKSISDAFRTMATSIIESMLDMATNALAANIFEGISGLFGFGGGGGGGLGSLIPGKTGSAVSVSNLPPLMNSGGIVRAASGYGPSTRDNVPIIAREGEAILRNSAVQMIGEDNVRRMNAMGNRSISQGVNAVAGIAQPQGQKDAAIVNVYVVSPEEKPSLTPNDVVAIIDENIVKGGSTNKLIKQVIV